MAHQLGIHWLRYHADGRDFDHIAKMQYRSAKTFEWMHNNRDFCSNLLAVLPQDAYILARNHPRSEQKDDVWRDPQGTGVRHADEWARDIQSGQCHLPTDRTFFLGVNEPDATSGDRNAIDLYTAAYLNRLRQHGLRGGGFSFSTGHPRTVDGTGATKADYTVFGRSHRAIVDGHHIGVLHIYGTAAQPLVPGHYDRIWACPWQDVEWIVGECGADEHVVGGGNHDGYLISMRHDRTAYCTWLDRLIMGVRDWRIHSWMPFTYDYSHPWSSFDMRDIRDALETYVWQHVKHVQTKPVDTHLPTVTSPATFAYVNAPAGVNLRTEPSSARADTILATVPYREQVRVVGMDDSGSWLRVRVGEQEGYVAAMLVSETEPPLLTPSAPQEPPAPIMPAPVEPLSQVPPLRQNITGILDPLVALAFLEVESGGRAFADGLLVIRFEVHRFKANLRNDSLFDMHFRFTPGNYNEQYWRETPGAPWINAHGPMSERHRLLNFARGLNDTAALRSTGMGLGQIMGENHARIGYPSVQVMFNAFRHPRLGVNAQIMGFVNYCLSDPALLAAMRAGDFTEMARRYNGIGQEQVYAPALQKALARMRQEIGDKP